ncbi:MAG TPA: cytochrome c [Kofleriaceae bacterium]|nr:cytochrome c [Kofleriaceae bacterium]
MLAASVAIAAPPAPTPKLLETGKSVYNINCAACHGEAGDGKGPVAFSIKPPPRNFKKDPFKAGDGVGEIFKTVTSGLPNTKMVGYPQLTEEQRWALAYYVRAFRVSR